MSAKTKVRVLAGVVVALAIGVIWGIVYHRDRPGKKPAAVASATPPPAPTLSEDHVAKASPQPPDRKPPIAVSREAVQTATDASAITAKKMNEERLADERQVRANAGIQRKEQAQSDAAKAQSDMAANQAASATAVATAQADAEQSRLAAQHAQQSAQQAETDKAAVRARLSEQLNSILETRDSARGIIVSMSDVLFDTGKYSLKPGAREKLAKIAGILLAYPGLNIEVGGYTDNIGGDEMNQTLSENRARSVRDYLVQQGVSTNSITARGFGKTLPPVTSNDNAAGRQQNGRVELLVSGDAIGNENGRGPGE